MSTHDPRQVVENLRNHLAMHDSRISFLFGAGTSSSINIADNSKIGARIEHLPLIPGIEGITTKCDQAISKMDKCYIQALETLNIQCKNNCNKVNIEHILSKVRKKIDAIDDGESLVGLNKGQLLEFERIICTTIAKTVNPEIIPEKIPHDEFASWVKKINRAIPIEIFTTNYDVLFEKSFEKIRVPVFDAFVGTNQPFFYPECLEDDDLLPKSNWVLLWKLHGSVNWTMDKSSNKENRIIRSIPSVSDALILPSSRKYDESHKEPYISYIERLSKILNKEHSLLITCGYSFGDDHINAILYSAMDNRKTTNIIALQFLDISPEDNLVKNALLYPNITVIGRNAGIISGTWGEWQLKQPVDKKTCSFMDLVFDSNASPEDAISPAAITQDLKGRMLIGDFQRFCSFLNSMSVENQ